VRVVIAEDQVLLREGLARLFADGGHDVVATLGDADSVVEVVGAEQPDLAVLDIRMPPTYSDEGARVAREIKDRHPEVGVLVLSQHIETSHAVDLVGRPGLGYQL
jgi:DNA-binding NarL/FixJ family response regulator